jgi:hypothetical protein
MVATLQKEVEMLQARAQKQQVRTLLRTWLCAFERHLADHCSTTARSAWRRLAQSSALHPPPINPPAEQDLEARIAAARKGMDAAKEQAEEQRQKVARLQESLA